MEGALIRINAVMKLEPLGQGVGGVMLSTCVSDPVRNVSSTGSWLTQTPSNMGEVLWYLAGAWVLLGSLR
jgi:hypothetical protein